MFRPGGVKVGKARGRSTDPQNAEKKIFLMCWGKFALGQAQNRIMGAVGHLPRKKKIVSLKLSLDFACPCLPCSLSPIIRLSLSALALPTACLHEKEKSLDFNSMCSNIGLLGDPCTTS